MAVHVITGLAVGGAEGYLYKHLDWMSKNASEENYVVSLTAGGVYVERLRALGVDVRSLDLDSGPLSIVKSIFAFLKLAIACRKQVWFFWMYHPMFISIFLPFVATKIWNVRRTEIPSKGVGKYLSRVNAWFSNVVPDTIVCCAHAAAMSHKAAGYSEKKIVVIPNGIDAELFKLNPALRESRRRELGFDSDQVVIGIVGRYAPIKGHLNLMAALQRIDLERFKVRVVMVGRDIATAEPLQSFLRDDALAKHTIVLPECGDVENLMTAFDFLCLPSDSEGFPNVVGEAMACGLPCVVTDVGDAAIIVGETGFVVPPKNIQALAEGLERMLGLDSAARCKLGQEARKRIENEFSIRRSWLAYKRFYNA